MADWHLAELDHALQQAGWRISEVLPGDGYRTSAVWLVTRSDIDERILFDGLDESGTALPLARSYACRVKRTNVSLYFGRKTKRAWKKDLARFVDALDA